MLWNNSRNRTFQCPHNWYVVICWYMQRYFIQSLRHATNFLRPEHEMKLIGYSDYMRTRVGRWKKTSGFWMQILGWKCADLSTKDLIHGGAPNILMHDIEYGSLIDVHSITLPVNYIVGVKIYGVWFSSQNATIYTILNWKICEEGWPLDFISHSESFS